ncbi:winged helix-turn-helix domain-containing protein [Nonomuraea sp. B19D2]|uniref:ArsR/SmtB family transcription factor n=1 Tax=Nonomuraea sp. B19D2 TaxID=3159561 RepID=UPI0032DAEFEC
MSTTRRAATKAEARALASTVRLRILRLCRDQALTNKEIAHRLGANPATTLHHVRTLVETGFLAAEPSRPGPRGSTEIPYRATGKSWPLDTREAGVPGSNAAIFEAFLQEIKPVDVEESWLGRVALRLTDEEHAEFQARLLELFDEFRARNSTGRPYSLFVALHRDTFRDGWSSADH